MLNRVNSGKLESGMSFDVAVVGTGFVAGHPVTDCAILKYELTFVL